AEGTRRQADPDAGDPLGQRQLLHREGVPRRAPGERPGTPPDSATLPGGERPDRTCQPDDTGEPGGGRSVRLGDGRACARAAGRSLQCGAIAQCVGVPATLGTLSRRPCEVVRGAACQAVTSPTSTTRTKSGIGTGNITI